MPQPLNQEVPDSLRNFDSLPDSAHVRQPVVQALFAISGATVWRRVRTGTLPRPYKHGPRTTSWNVGELRRALSGVVSEVSQRLPQ